MGASAAVVASAALVASVAAKASAVCLQIWRPANAATKAHQADLPALLAWSKRLGARQGYSNATASRNYAGGAH